MPTINIVYIIRRCIMLLANEVDCIEDYKVTEGWLYILEHAAYPGHYKLGLTTNLPRRLQSYNTHLPYPDVTLVAVSKKFSCVAEVEKQVIKEMGMYRVAKCEWFGSLDKLIEVVEYVESNNA